mmetsp:Transcript_5540/g.3169  ORF Transcript_5540/g.3169 Transcript_5540/m.3169 type:complete len:884 (-) Transcript_5540:76-2727(-)
MDFNPFDKGYEPKDIEKRWYDFWEKTGLFTATEEIGRKSYSIVMPPPNVTGVLHMGHALNVTMQDILCRYKKLKGYDVLWVPGTDHAGIATQNVVEKMLAEKENISRHALGRKKFVEAVWMWKNEYGRAIIGQLKRLGASCNWDRERFTMDAGLSKAVREVFVQLYKKDLIYKGNYIINWCIRCHTALADLEVEHEEIDGSIYYIRYPFEDGSKGLVVATTRPETMLGDTAVAVNPNDKRYQNLKAKVLILPLVSRRIPIIRDKYVDISFGTGALKVTPAHDPNDFEIGKRHGLESIKVIADDGSMTSKAGRFEGLDRFECRDSVVQALEKEGLLVKIEPHIHSVGHCYRCKTIIEPNLSEQWFVRTKPLAEKVIQAVKTGKTKIIPENWTKTYYNWLENIRDWCISRQIWWGHQIPAWKCQKCNNLIIETKTPRQCPKCGGNELLQDTDVLDTWFSSALWPFSTMGWPDKTKVLEKYYPTSVIITGFDILFFWVARMMMMGIHFMNEVPFKDIYVHALVRDEKGKKMSKSKGNVIDPLLIIDNYGTDAFRYALAAFAAQGRDIKMSGKRVEGYRHFINKLWNAARFSFMHIGENFEKVEITKDLSIYEKWILSRLAKVSKKVANALDNYKFNEGASVLYRFVWHEFCDWYLEAAKPNLYREAADKTVSKNVLYKVLKEVLILLHPFIPFVTEEIWHKLPKTKSSIIKAGYPSDRKSFLDEEAEKIMGLVIDVITGIRNVRGEMNISPSLLLNVTVHVADEKIRSILSSNQDIIINLARLKTFIVKEPGEKPKATATSVVNDISIYVSLEGIIDFTQETKRLEKKIDNISKELDSISAKLANKDFLEKAPDLVVEKAKRKYHTFEKEQKTLQRQLSGIKARLV